jgi:5S rRNA maturation endonuclease (ribonuclease M5)
VVEVQQERKDYLRAKHISCLLETLSEGTVIVEGAHDVRALGRLGISALTYSQLYKSLPQAGRTVYIMTDRDRGGEEKKAKIMAMLLESDRGYAIDDSAGKRLLRMTNSTSVEQVCGPIEELMGKTGGKTKM